MSDFLNGSGRSRFQDNFDEALWGAEWFRNFWGAIDYALFSEGREGVLVGREGMLFTTEEWTEPERTLSQCMEEILQAKEQLEKEGVVLLIALVPAKAGVYPSEAQPYTRSASMENRYGDWMNWFEAQGISAPDLLTPFRESEVPLFYLTDTHWNGAGADLAARIMAEELTPMAREKSILPSPFELVQGEEISFEGDLVAYIPGHQWVRGKSLNREIYKEIEAVNQGGGGLGLFDLPEIPVALTGTSYSWDKRWNWEGRLKSALSLDLLNLSEEGKGPFVPMENLLSEGYYRETGA
ncbi:MAG: hypothetical protein PQJ60_00820, partial [Spirochaetales bacterium]|nr:hypothetical protein [Spirochaetales bacterium]